MHARRRLSGWGILRDFPEADRLPRDASRQARDINRRQPHLSARWDDSNSDDEDDMPFGMPSPYPPEGRELIGLKTPLGMGRMRWTSTGKAWITGDGFDLPMQHFEPSTLEPVYGPPAGEATAQDISRRPAMRTMEMRYEDQPRFVVDDLVYRNPAPGADRRLKFVQLQSAPTGGEGGNASAPAKWPPSPGAPPFQPSAFNPDHAPGLAPAGRSEPTGTVAQHTAFSGESRSIHGPSSGLGGWGLASPQTDVPPQESTPASTHLQDPPAHPVASTPKPRSAAAREKKSAPSDKLLHQSPPTYRTTDEAALAIAPQVESMKGQIKGWGDWEVSGEIGGLKEPYSFNVWQGGPEGFDFTATPNIAAAYHFHYKNKAGSVNDRLSDNRTDRTLHGRDGDVQGAQKMMKHFKREVPIYLFYYNDRGLLNIKYFPHPASNPEEFRWVQQRPGS